MFAVDHDLLELLSNLFVVGEDRALAEVGGVACLGVEGLGVKQDTAELVSVVRREVPVV